MAGCYDDVQDLLTSVNDSDKHIRIVYVSRPDAMWRSSGCYVCECRVPLLEGAWIGEAHHVYSWGNQDGGDPDENACHVSLGNVCHVSSGGRGPYNAPLLTCPFCPGKMGGLKNNCFLKLRLLFLRSLGYVASEGEEREEHL